MTIYEEHLNRIRKHFILIESLHPLLPMHISSNIIFIALFALFSLISLFPKIGKIPDLIALSHPIYFLLKKNLQKEMGIFFMFFSLLLYFDFIFQYLSKYFVGLYFMRFILLLYFGTINREILARIFMQNQTVEQIRKNIQEKIKFSRKED